ncbi:MAG TPA: VOC family protein [Myxococcota bacterium]|nr:VOC family protein [Myxococcota bacterium]
MQPRTDVGLTHVALVVRDVTASIAFYERFARMQVVHRRREATEVAWLSDLTRPFVIVLIEGRVDARLAGFCHLGLGCASREEVDRLCSEATRDDRLALGPIDSGYPVGYWAFIRDPDGHNLEISYGQEVGLAVAEARKEAVR